MLWAVPSPRFAWLLHCAFQHIWRTAATVADPPAVGVLTVSKETRVRIDGLVKIMAIVLPAKGLKLSSRCRSFSFT